MRVLLVGGGPADADTLRSLLSASGSMRFEVLHATRLADALALPGAREADALLLDVAESDLPRMSVLTQARLSAPLIPIVVLSEADDESVALKALQNGARGYLVKGEANTRLLVTTLGAALESHRMILQLNTAS